MALIIARNRVIICLLFLLSVNSLASSSPVNAQSSSVVPVLSSAVAAAISPGTVSVAGEGFTAGGLVFIALHDAWGNQLLETRWTSASAAVYGENGSQDPARGFSESGTIRESFELFRVTLYGPNGSQDPARGYSPGTDLQGFEETVHGPNGSQDPAQGYRPGTSISEMADLFCEQSLMVRAFDQQTSSWSNLLDLEMGC